MILAIIQARMGSTRLPGKILKPILGKPLILHLIERLQHSKLINQIVIATGDKKENQPLIELCQKNNINIFVGSEDNVLDRCYQAAKKFVNQPEDIIVRITGDCPVIDPQVTDKTIQFYLDNKETFDYVNNGIEHTYPDGLGTEVFPFKILETAWQEATKQIEKEHVTTFIRNPKRFRLGIVKNNQDLSHLRWTIDTPEDFEFITQIYHYLYPKKKIFLMNDIFQLLQEKPKLQTINQNISRDEGFQKSLQKESIPEPQTPKQPLSQIHWQPYQTLHTKNLALWPSLFITKSNQILLSWYEYSSPTHPQATNIFFSKINPQTKQFETPTKITSYSGYDNGPNLFVDHQNTTWLSWHSWRPPGKGPFIPDSCENIWMKYQKDNQAWSESFLVFPSLAGTNYPSLIQNQNKTYTMAFSIEENQEIYVSQSENGINWQTPKKIHFPNLLRADIIQEQTGQYLIACEQETNHQSNIIIIQSSDLLNWKQISTIPQSENGRRPKISQDRQNQLFVTWQTDHWPAQEITATAEVTDGQLQIEFSAENSGGNHCWVLNHLEIFNPQLTKKFDFGNKETNTNNIIKINSQNSTYTPEKGYGFTQEIHDLMRSFVKGPASDMVFSEKDNTFQVDLPNGNYHLKLLISSWVASSKRTTIKINQQIIFQPSQVPIEQVFYSSSSDSCHWSTPQIIEKSIYDQNRPSKILSDSNHYYLATTSFDQTGVNIKLYQGEKNNKTKNKMTIQIADKTIGEQSHCFIIAEIGSNFNHNLDTAKEMIKLAAQAGADAVKFQSYHADQLLVKEMPEAAYHQAYPPTPEEELPIIRINPDSQLIVQNPRYNLIKNIELPDKWTAELARYARKQNIIFFSSPWDKQAVAILEEAQVPVYKIGSGELTNYPFIKYVASQQKPIILSIGMATSKEINQAINTIKSTGNHQISLLHCIVDYPTRPELVNLNYLQKLQEEYPQYPIGYSDHSTTNEISLAAVALGAKVIEKHVTLSRDQTGPDHNFALTFTELKQLIKEIKNIEQALGRKNYQPGTWERERIQRARRNAYTTTEIPAGTIIQEDQFSFLRPNCGGIEPHNFNKILGKKTKKKLPIYHLITKEDLI